MKRFLTAGAIALLLSSCGYSSYDNELVGQVKKTRPSTPLICYNHNDVDISLGVMRNGTGSMSTQDLWLYVPRDQDFELLKKASETGKLVKVRYKTARFTICVDADVVQSAEMME